MTDRYDICTPRPGKDGKTYWTRIGSGFPRDDGSISLSFDALPVGGHDEKYGYRVSAMLFPAKPREGRAATPQGGGDPDERIPFAPDM